jgi:glutamine amidotransferase
MISIVNYGLGNVQAIANIYKQLNIPVEVASGAADVRRAERLILPGVGAFDWAMTRLNESGMRDALQERVVGGGTPVLGICVGMQMLARSSAEGRLEGLAWIDGEVRKLGAGPGGEQPSLPHMGWNDVEPRDDAGLFRSLASDARFYFLHSYFVAPARTEDLLASVTYHVKFAAAIRSGNVHGVQFHPEKSHRWGIQLLRNFAEMTAC